MSVELSLSIRTFLTSQLAMPTIITIGSSCSGSTPMKSTSVNIIDGIDLLELTVEIWFTLLMASKCLFRAVLVLPPPAKLPAMVLMTSLLTLHRLLRCQLDLAWRRFVLACHRGIFVLGLHNLDHDLSNCLCCFRGVDV